MAVSRYGRIISRYGRIISRYGRIISRHGRKSLWPYYKSPRRCNNLYLNHSSVPLLLSLSCFFLSYFSGYLSVAVRLYFFDLLTLERCSRFRVRCHFSQLSQHAGEFKLFSFHLVISLFLVH